jgi:hypothetical protein
MSLASNSQALSSPLQPPYSLGFTAFRPMCNDIALALVVGNLAFFSILISSVDVRQNFAT